MVNALAVGYFGPEDKVFTSGARGVGNYVVYVDRRAEMEFTARVCPVNPSTMSESKKPTVQIGDPFMEKLLIESCLEVMAEDLVSPFKIWEPQV
ncbi:MAG: hypothetical protein R2827_11280 [Bdellovibrionales bacterium]